MSKNLATLIGLSAILQWSSIVGLLKKISFSLGAELAVLLMYTLSTCILLIFFKIPNLKLISKNLDLSLNRKIKLQLWLHWIIIDQLKIFWFDVEEISSIRNVEN